ncbi:MAG: zinc ribbon domain-containing protein [Dysgonamonadaceae bacterium]|jgi:hypothetical protein|nr:zinc ribbon domain-containing protein [Dysgonamonadaceae bacterium]
MNTNFVNIIKRIIAEQGDDILANPQRLKGYVADYAAAESKAERLAFGRCIEAGAYNELKDAPDAAARQAVKAALAQRVHSSEGLDLALCNDALDALEAGLIEVKPLCQKCGKELQEGWKMCPFCGTAQTAAVPVASAESVSNSAPETTLVTPMSNAAASAVTTASAKKHTLRNLWIVVAVLIVAAIGIDIAVKYPYVQLSNNDEIIFRQIENNDELTDNLALTLRDVKVTQKFIKKNFPKFDFEEHGHVTDDYRNELLVKEFNSSPNYLSISLDNFFGIAGKSAVFAWLAVPGKIGEEGRIYDYDFNINHTFSDKSGFCYCSTRLYTNISNRDRDRGRRIESIHLEKESLGNISFWSIVWYKPDSHISEKERITLLKSFFNELRYTVVYRKFARDFLKDVYIGIGLYQVKDIVDWYK